MAERSLSTEVIDDAMAEAVRRKVGAERLAIVALLYWWAWDLVEANV